MFTRSMYAKHHAELLNHTQLNKRAKEHRAEHRAKKKTTQNNLNRALAQLLRSTEALQHEERQMNAAAQRRPTPSRHLQEIHHAPVRRAVTPPMSNREKAQLVARVRKNAAAAERLKAQRWRAKRAKAIR